MDDPFDRTVACGAGNDEVPTGCSRTRPCGPCPLGRMDGLGAWLRHVAATRPGERRWRPGLPGNHWPPRHHHLRHAIRPEAHLRCTGREGRAGYAGQRPAGSVLGGCGMNEEPHRYGSMGNRTAIALAGVEPRSGRRRSTSAPAPVPHNAAERRGGRTRAAAPIEAASAAARLAACGDTTGVGRWRLSPGNLA